MRNNKGKSFNPFGPHRYDSFNSIYYKDYHLFARLWRAKNKRDATKIDSNNLVETNQSSSSSEIDSHQDSEVKISVNNDYFIGESPDLEGIEAEEKLFLGVESENNENEENPNRVSSVGSIDDFEVFTPNRSSQINPGLRREDTPSPDPLINFLNRHPVIKLICGLFGLTDDKKEGGNQI